MSPLWQDIALARAAWAKAVERGLVDDRDESVVDKLKLKSNSARVIPRRPASSFAS